MRTLFSANVLGVTATLALAALAPSTLLACGDDDAPSASPDPNADAGDDAPTLVDASDAASPQLALLSRADDAPTSSTHLVAVDLAKGTIAGELVQDGIATVRASGGRAFLLDRDRDRFVALDPGQPWKATWTHEPASADAPSANAIVASADQAFVLRRGSNSIEVLALADGAHVDAIDLSRFVDPLDSDGLVDVSDGVFDATKGRVYVVLPRDRALDPQERCSGSQALFVGIDAATHAIVDLNGDAAGEAITLAGQWPAPPGGGAFVDGHGLSAYFVDQGCYGSAGLTGAGVERVDLLAGSAMLVAPSALGVPLATLLRVDDAHGYVETAAPDPAWRAWDPSSTSLGAVASGMPSIAAVAGARVIGLAERAIATGTTLDAVAFDPKAQTLTFVAQDVLRGAHLASAGVVVP